MACFLQLLAKGNRERFAAYGPIEPDLQDNGAIQSMAARSPDNETRDPAAVGSHTGASRRLSRRAMLKGSMATMPAIMTLHSGAALARSSNLISEAAYATTDADGRTLCLDVDSVYPASDTAHVYDLGDPPYAHVNAINDRDHRLEPHRNAAAISEADMCRNGPGPYYYPSSTNWGQWSEVHVKQGVIVSATALSSFAGSVVITDL